MLATGGPRISFPPGGAVNEKPHIYSVTTPQLNQWGLSGDWTVGDERAVLNRKDGSIVYRFHAWDLHHVLGSKSGGPVRFKVTIDGKPPGDSHGTDVDGEGAGIVRGERLYQSNPAGGKSCRPHLRDPFP